MPEKLFIDDKKKIFFSLQENHDEMINQACEAAAAIFFKLRQKSPQNIAHNIDPI